MLLDCGSCPPLGELPPPGVAWFSAHNDFFRFRLQELRALLPSAEISAAPADAGFARFAKAEKDVASFPRALINFAAFGSEAAITVGKDDCVFVPLAQLPNDADARHALSRAVLLKGVAQVFYRGPGSYEALLQHFACPKRGAFESCDCADDKCPRSKTLRQFIHPNRTFAFSVHLYGSSATMEQKVERMRKLSPLFSGQERADLRNPDVRLVLLERWERRADGDVERRELWFGRALAERPRDGSPPWWWPYRLPARPVLGPTTLDTELSFLMATQARVGKGSVVLDPFCGTGGLLLAAAALGASSVIGSDIDIRVLKGYGVSRVNHQVQQTDGSCDIFKNFDAYKLPRPEIVRCDVAAWGRRLVAPPAVDAVLADPPYGIRATVRRTDDGGETLCTAVAEVHAVVLALLRASAVLLVPGGRLVFLFPCDYETHFPAVLQLSETGERLGLRLESASLQTLPAGKCRVLITMKRGAASPPQPLQH